MRYYYELNKKDLINMGLKPGKSDRYGVEQDGWTCVFYELYEIVENEFGAFKEGQPIVKKLTEQQEDYIRENCKMYM